MLSWFIDLNEELVAFVDKYKSTLSYRRRPLAQPNKPMQGSTGGRKMDIGFVSDPNARRDSRCHWSHILVLGELKSNLSADIASKVWLDLGVREWVRAVGSVSTSRSQVHLSWSRATGFLGNPSVGNRGLIGDPLC